MFSDALLEQPIALDETIEILSALSDSKNSKTELAKKHEAFLA